MIAYCDSSVLVRFILEQPDSLVELAACDRLVTSVVTQVECLRTTENARLRGELRVYPARSARTDAPVDTSRMRPLPGSPRSWATRGPSRDRPARSTNAPHAHPYRDRPLSDDELAGRRRAAYARLSGIERIEASPSILGQAERSFGVVLKTLDAIHVATALVWRERRAPGLVFATHDRQQARAATALGFDVLGVK